MNTQKRQLRPIWQFIIDFAQTLALIGSLYIMVMALALIG